MQSQTEVRKGLSGVLPQATIFWTKCKVNLRECASGQRKKKALKYLRLSSGLKTISDKAHLHMEIWLIAPFQQLSAPHMIPWVYHEKGNNKTEGKNDKPKEPKGHVQS